MQYVQRAVIWELVRVRTLASAKQMTAVNEGLKQSHRQAAIAALLNLVKDDGFKDSPSHQLLCARECA